MKLLLEQNISYKVLKELNEHFPESAQAGRIGLGQAGDREVWNFAKVHGYTLVTYEATFHEISLLLGAPPKVIWLKCEDTSPKNVACILIKNKNIIENFIRDKKYICLEIYE
ncbi:MAG: DUF5615 family PIN-like protein [Microscillaceae bacterium]|nr:DUF5615 family PIN-like protein [Microscillaceae bacterium]MDW8461359.1 DUF5615 family PIN-like protein [Cytophagales bacterium]